MSLFQRTVISNFADATDKQRLDALYARYCAIFGSENKQNNIRAAKEEQYQEGFLRDLFVDVMGYTINPNPDWNLTTELKNERDSKKADGAVIVNSAPRMVIELKSVATKDLRTVEAQAFGYRNSHEGVRYVVISNFERLRFYIDNAVDYEEFHLFTLSRNEFTLLWILLAYENVKTDLPLRLREASVIKEQDISELLYKDYAAFKRDLFSDMRERNPQYEPLLLFRKSQKLMDRILFILFAEDRGLIPPNKITYINNNWEQYNAQQEEFGIGDQRPLYDFYKGIFNNLHKGSKDIFAYNGGLFYPDEVLDNITLSSELLLRHTRALTCYDFGTEVDVNIMGHIFEHSLAEIEEVTAALSSGAPVATDKRAKDGIFYTPSFITRYMVQNTLGQLMESYRPLPPVPDASSLSEKKKKALVETWESYRARLLSLTICDPACGSGAFLNAALERLMEEHRLIDETLAFIRGETLILSDIENAILEHNLYGVDINEESVEIAKLSLWLRTAQKGRKLSTLSSNIRVGNSLIDSCEHAPHNAFDWKKNFPHVFAKGGFDIILGNPPYVALQTMREQSEIYSKLGYEAFDKNGDLYCLFSERAYNLLKPGGCLTFIMPNKWMLTDYGKGLRAFMSRTGLRQIINFGDVQFFRDATTYVCIFHTQKAEPADTVQALSLNRKTYHGDFMAEISAGLSPYPASEFGENPWLIRPKEHTAVLNKMQQHPPLVSLPIEINYGVKTGLNDAFFIDDTTRNTLIEQDPRSAEIIKPMLRGRDIAAWTNRGKPEWLIATFPALKLNIDDYPAVRDFLLAFGKERLEQSGRKFTTEEAARYGANAARKKTSNRWFETQDSISYHTTFAEPKIIYPNMTSLFPFMFDENSYFINDKAFILSSSEKDREYMLALTAIFNSKAAKLWIWYNCPELQGGTREIRKVYFEKFPVPDLGESKSELAGLAEQRTEAEKAIRHHTQRFLHRVSAENGGKKLSNKLSEFTELDFTAFLKASGLKLRLAEKDEWEEYFDSACSRLRELHTHTRLLDMQLESLIGRLYGFSDSEYTTLQKLDI